MFESVKVDIANQWFDLSPGRLAELLVFYDKIELISPAVPLNDLVKELSFEEAKFLSELCRTDRLNLTLNPFPYGEIAIDCGILGGLWSRASEGTRRDHYGSFGTPNILDGDARRKAVADIEAERELLLDFLADSSHEEMGCSKAELISTLRPMVERVEMAGSLGYSKQQIDKLGTAITKALDQGQLRNFLVSYYRLVDRYDQQEAERLADGL